MSLILLLRFSKVDFSTSWEHNYSSAKPLHLSKFVVKHKSTHHNAEAFPTCSYNWQLVIVEQADRQKHKNLAYRPKEAD